MVRRIANTSLLPTSVVVRSTRRHVSSHGHLRRPLRAVVSLSGGVDSSVAAYLMLHHAPKDALIVVGAAHSTNWTVESEADLNDDQHRARGHTSLPRGCSRELDAAKEVAELLKLPLMHCDCEAEYYTGVMLPTVEAFNQAGSFNPDCECNRLVKFGPYLDAVLRRYDADVVVTGHYAIGAHHWIADAAWRSAFGAPAETPRRQPEATVAALRQPLAWKTNDQSFYLATVPRERLQRALFPLGSWPDKASVRRFAEAVGLPAARKPTSTGLCFVGQRDFTRLMKDQAEVNGLALDLWSPGDLVEDLRDGSIVADALPTVSPPFRPIHTAEFTLFTPGTKAATKGRNGATNRSDTNTVARHHGVAKYTLGQRLSLQCTRTGVVHAAYVSWKCANTNRLYVVLSKNAAGAQAGASEEIVPHAGTWQDRRLLYRGVHLRQWVVQDAAAWDKYTVAAASANAVCFVVLRHLQPPVQVKVTVAATRDGNAVAFITCVDGDAVLRAPTPGQTAVIYVPSSLSQERDGLLTAVATGIVTTASSDTPVTQEGVTMALQARWQPSVA